MTDTPVLLGCSHGTASPAGQAAVSALVRAVARAHPEVEVGQGFVDVEAPDVATALAARAGRAVRVLPLLLSAGYHVHVDLTEAVAAADPHHGAPVSLMKALGPDPALTAVLADRVGESLRGPGGSGLGGSGLQPDDVVLLGAAGSSDPRAVADCEAVAAQLADRLAHPVRATYGSAVEPRLGEAVRQARESGAARVVVATYLLAPGWFNDLVGRCGADVVTAPLLGADRDPDPRLVELVWRRYQGL